MELLSKIGIILFAALAAFITAIIGSLVVFVYLMYLAVCELISDEEIDEEINEKIDSTPFAWKW